MELENALMAVMRLDVVSSSIILEVLLFTCCTKFHPIPLSLCLQTGKCAVVFTLNYIKDWVHVVQTRNWHRFAYNRYLRVTVRVD